MQLLGYMVGNSGFPEEGLNVLTGGSANKDKTWTLTIKELGVSSSVVYFCAARWHSVEEHYSSVQKPPPLLFPHIIILQPSARV